MLAGRSSQTEGPATLKLLIVLLESNTSAVRVAVAGLPRLVTMRYSVVLTNRTGVALGGIAQVSADGALELPPFEAPAAAAVAFVRIEEEQSAVPSKSDDHEALQPATHLLCEYLSSPVVAISEPRPRFSWHPYTPSIDGARGVSQAAYSLTVNCPNSEISWSSGRVASNVSSNVEYGGVALPAFATCTWQVKWWSSDGRVASPSAPAVFGVGPMSEADWGAARWIGGEDARQMRLDFSVPGQVCRAVLYCAAPGGATLSLDGAPVGAQNGIGAFTNPHHRILYTAHEITAQLNGSATEQHTLGVMLGHGMWGNYHLTSSPGAPTVRIKLVLEACAPTAQLHAIESGSGFLCSSGPIVSAVSPVQTMRGGSGSGSWNRTWIERFSDDPFRGTITDLRLQQADWDSVRFANKSAWGACPLTANPPAGKLRALMVPYTEAVRRIKPVSVVELPHEYGGAVRIVDFGENIVGQTEVAVAGPAGAAITVRHAETLLANGSLNINWTCGAGPCGCGCCAEDPTCVGVKAEFQRNQFILSGASAKGLTGRFSWFGFRFAAIHVSGGATLQSIEAVVLHTPLAPAGRIEFSDDPAGRMLTDVHAMVGRTRTGNMVQYAPTDCPSKAVTLSRFVALSVSLTLQASPLQLAKNTFGWTTPRSQGPGHLRSTWRPHTA